ncbi:helix-turn-helix domain-containing protein [Shewanella acanthi]|uniref:helix-turn-helix domain-containing protein n=1 Tax=Shewanella acanthi TaxID=2864212 RepID=UPI001C65FA6F|nr:helix-turn-helix transcriptional regulator [Shewanella acanthi]QYJ80101.1 helix-turn-helix domain-containing protein [Shewanella acanthi]
MNAHQNKQGFAHALKFWRTARNISQEELALRIDSAARHICRLERGDAFPSVKMLDRIASALMLEQTDKINLYCSAGFSAGLSATDIHLPEYSVRKSELIKFLKCSEPYPAVICDVAGNFVMVNRAWLGLYDLMVPKAQQQPLQNVLSSLFDYAAMHMPHDDWASTLSVLLLSVQQNLTSRNTPQDQKLLKQLMSLPFIPANWQELAAQTPVGRKFNIKVNIKGQQETFTTFTQSTGLKGPLVHSSVPDLLTIVFYPERDELDLEPLVDPASSHPLLFY